MESAMPHLSLSNQEHMEDEGLRGSSQTSSIAQQHSSQIAERNYLDLLNFLVSKILNSLVVQRQETHSIGCLHISTGKCPTLDICYL